MGLSVSPNGTTFAKLGGSALKRYPGSNAPTIPHVADANARLSLDPTTHPTDTFQVIQDDDGLTYTLTGPGADADAGLWVKGAGQEDCNGAYKFNGTRYDQITMVNRVQLSVTRWVFLGILYQGITSSLDYAWQETEWDAITGDPPAPVVTRNPIASEANWSTP